MTKINALGFVGVAEDYVAKATVDKALSRI